LDEVEDNERRKVEPLRRKAGRTERELKARIGQQRQRAAKAETQTSSVKRNLAAAAKWKSWQRPFGNPALCQCMHAAVYRPVSLCLTFSSRKRMSCAGNAV